jgi:hypothetical protein
LLDIALAKALSGELAHCELKDEMFEGEIVQPPDNLLGQRAESAMAPFLFEQPEANSPLRK